MAMAQSPQTPFRVAIYRAIWIATLVSNFGGLIQSVGASWMMTALSGTAPMVALVQASTTLPIMLFSLLAGAVADNLDRRLVMLVAQIFMLIVSAALAAFAYFGVLGPLLLLAFTFLLGCGTALNGPAWQASVGDMVPREMMAGAIAYNGMGFNIARSVGPAIGGAIVAAVGAAGAFLVNALSYVGLAVILYRWRPIRVVSALPRERLGAAMLSGIGYVAMSPHILVVLLRASAFGIGASAVQALLPLVSKDLVAGGPLIYGLLLGAFGAGAVAGALTSARLRQTLSTEAIVRVSTLLISVGAAGAGGSRSILLTLPALALAGGGWVLALSTFNISVQMASPRWVVARAIALYQMAAFGGMALGSLCFGELADHVGVSIALYGAALTLLGAAAIGWALPIGQVSASAGLETNNDWEAPDLAVAIEDRSGPIDIIIEHRIADGSTMPFLMAMSERRRIRRRNGARNWTLFRDLGDAELWFERYQVPTWLDYVRHLDRRTLADTVNSDALRRLRIGGGEPVVHRMVERQVGSLPPAAKSAAPRVLAEPLTDPTRSS